MTMYNVKTKNGRINLGRPNSNVIVNPQDHLFDTQVEDGVRECVIAFNQKGYVTVGSCEGHVHEHDAPHYTCWHISVVVGSLGVLNTIQTLFKTPFIHTGLKHAYEFDVGWFNSMFQRQYSHIHIINVYAPSSIVQTNKLAKRLVAWHCSRRINRLPALSLSGCLG